MQGVRIILLSVAAAVAYGIVHDQVTARISVEYFTIGHPFIGTHSPLLLGLFWGVVATWWVGLPLGLVLWLAARSGSRPALGARDLVRPVVKLLCVVGCCALLAGTVGYLLARNGAVWLRPPLADKIPQDRHVAFLTALWSHVASYWAGTIGGIALAVLTWRRRGRIAEEAAAPAALAGGIPSGYPPATAGAYGYPCGGPPPRRGRYLIVAGMAAVGTLVYFVLNTAVVLVVSQFLNVGDLALAAVATGAVVLVLVAFGGGATLIATRSRMCEGLGLGLMIGWGIVSLTSRGLLTGINPYLYL